jgi:hypothetical protein
MAKRSCAGLVLLGVALAVMSATLSGCPTRDLKVNKMKSVTDIEEHRGVCFPADAVVIGEKGPKRMADVQIGDSLLGMSAQGKIEYTQVRAWLHRDVDAVSNMTVIETTHGRVVASAKHSIAVDSEGSVKYTYADDLEEGHKLFAQNGSAARVLGKGVQATTGFYSPLTYTSNFFVGSSAESAILAHGFAHNPAPVFSARVVDFLMNIAEFFSSSVHEIGEKQQRKYLHPVLRAVLVVCPIVSVDAGDESPSVWRWLQALRGAAEDKDLQVNIV